MASKVEILWKQALKTFAGRRNAGFKLCPQNFDKLWTLMNKMTAEDVKLDDSLIEYIKVQPAPMWVIDVVANEDMNIAIFILKSGIKMPLHNHPGMHGLLKVLTGVVNINSYSFKSQVDAQLKMGDKIVADKHRTISADHNSPACVLTPLDRNLHEIVCIEGPAAFLDILSPPYVVDEYGKGPRPCTFFRVVNSKSAESAEAVENVQIVVSEIPPDFYSETLKYRGPPLS